jgi:hypothetical protein
MPLARYSSTSDTVMRVPATQALPLRTPGVQVIRGGEAVMVQVVRGVNAQAKGRSQGWSVRSGSSSSSSTPPSLAKWAWMRLPTPSRGW